MKPSLEKDLIEFFRLMMIEFSFDPRKALVFILNAIAVFLIVSFVLFFWSLISSSIDTKLFDKDLCIKSECLNFYYESLPGTFKLLELIGRVFFLICSTSGILIALMNYISSSESSRLSNHLSHISIFTNYIDAEISRFDRLEPKSFDTLRMYNHIFRDSRSGKTTVSEDYKKTINDLNLQIEKSNSKAKKAKEGSFRYKEHQNEVINIIKNLGVTINFMPRNDFYEVETQLLSLIGTVNLSFCGNDQNLRLMVREYL